MAEEPQNESATAEAGGRAPAGQAAPSDGAQPAQAGQPAQASQPAQAAPAAQATPACPAPALSFEPPSEQIDFDTFARSDLRVVRVKACEAVPKSKKLLRFTLDDGTGADRTILSGIHAYYEPEELVGKTLVAVVNIPPRKMMGLESCGMLLSAVHEEDGEERLSLIMVDGSIPAGSKLC